MNSILVTNGKVGYLRLVLTALLFMGCSVVHGQGVVIFSSWANETTATTEAARTSEELGVTATVESAQISNDEETRTTYRVVVEVGSGDEADQLVSSATEKGWSPWYLETSIENQQPAPPPIEGNGEGGETETQLSPADGIIESVDDPSVESTLAELEAVRQRAQSLISDFVEREQFNPENVLSTGQNSGESSDSTDETAPPNDMDGDETGEVAGSDVSTPEVSAPDGDGDMGIEETEPSLDPADTVSQTPPSGESDVDVADVGSMRDCIDDCIETLSGDAMRDCISSCTSDEMEGESTTDVATTPEQSTVGGTNSDGTEETTDPSSANEDSAEPTSSFNQFTPPENRRRR